MQRFFDVAFPPVLFLIDDFSTAPINVMCCVAHMCCDSIATVVDLHCSPVFFQPDI